MQPSEPPISEVNARVKRVKGPGLAMVRGTLRASLPEQAWAAFLERLAPDSRAFFLAPADPQAWVEADLLAGALEEFQRWSGRELTRLQGDLTAQIYRQEEASLFRRPEDLLAAVPLLWRESFEGGLAQILEQGPTGTTIGIWAIVPFAPWMSDFLVAWFQGAFEACGLKQVGVAYEPPSAPAYFHCYRCTWSPA